MEVEYIRDMYHNYLVIKEENKQEDVSDYGLKMLLHNKIDGLLEMNIRQINEQLHYYYDITGRHTLGTILDTTKVTYTQIKSIIMHIIDIMESSREYLLKEDNFVINPNYIFINYTDFKVLLCYKIGYNQSMKQQLRGFMEYLMDKVNYEDQNAVLLVYGLYKASTEENCTFHKLKNILNTTSQSLELNVTNKVEKSVLEEETKSKESYKKDNNREKYKRDEIKQGSILEDVVMQPGKETKREIPIDNTKAKVKIRTEDINGKDKVINTIDTINVNSNNKDNKKSSHKNSHHKKSDIPETRKEHHKGTQNKSPVTIPLMLEKFTKDMEIEQYPLGVLILAIGSILVSILIILCLLRMGFLNNSIGNKLDMTKVVGVFIVIGSLEGYLLSRILNKKNKETRMIKKDEYIDLNSESFKIENQGRIKREKQGDYEALGKTGKSDSDSSPLSKQYMEYGEYDDKKFNYVREGYSDYNTPVNEISRNDVDADELFEIDSEDTMLLADLERNIEYRLVACNAREYTDIDLIEFPFFIGKLKTNVDYTLKDNAVSRFHIKIEKEEDKFYVTDLNSTNGTYLNQIKLNPNRKTDLSLGSELIIAHIKYVFSES